MKSITSLSIDTELLEKIKALNVNCSEWLTRLIEKEFSDDEDTLREKMLVCERELTVSKARLNEKISQRVHNEQRLNQKKMLTKEQEERRLTVEEIKRKWASDEITDGEYWTFFDGVKNGN